MACTTTDIKIVRKDGPMVIFDLEDGTCVKYDLQHHTTIGKQGKVVQGLNSQLCGAMLIPSREKFEDQGFFEYLKSIMHAGGRSAYTISAVLKRVVYYQEKEGFARLGISTHGNFRTLVNQLPKEMLKWLTAKDRKNAFTLQQYHIDAWIKDREVFQSMLSQRDTLYKDSFDRMIFNMLEDGRYSYNSSPVLELVDKYRCEPTAIARYLVMIETREGVDIRQAPVLLRDYHKMQTAMVQGYHKYEKYPMHLMYAHHLVQRNFNRLCTSRFNDDEFSKTYNPNLEMTMGGYDFICPHTVAQIKDEAVQQQHCVASYIDNVLKGECHIILMRKHHDPNRAAITLEVIGGKVNHAAGQYNREPTDEEWKVIADYERFIPEDWMTYDKIEEEKKHAV